MLSLISLVGVGRASGLGWLYFDPDKLVLTLRTTTEGCSVLAVGRIIQRKLVPLEFTPSGLALSCFLVGSNLNSEVSHILWQKYSTERNLNLTNVKIFEIAYD